LREERGLRVFENWVLRGVFDPKRDEVTGEWRKLHKEELQDLYSPPTIVRVIKSRRIKCTGHVARIGEGIDVYGVLAGKPEKKRPLGIPRSRWMLKKWDVGVWTGLGWLRIGTGGTHL
jgi:hypothetical protein